jgi:hypothetical protein
MQGRRAGIAPPPEDIERRRDIFATMEAVSRR